MSAADRQLARGMRELDAAVLALEGTDENAPAPLRSAAADVSRLEGEVARGEAALVGLGADQEALSAARTTLAEVEAQLDIDRDELDGGRGGRSARGRVRVAAERLARLRRAVGLERTIEEKESPTPPVPLDVSGPAWGASASSTRRSPSVVPASPMRSICPTSTYRRPSRAGRCWPWSRSCSPCRRRARRAHREPALHSRRGCRPRVRCRLDLDASPDPRTQRHYRLREEQIERRLRGRSALEFRLREAEEFRDAQLRALWATDSTRRRRFLRRGAAGRRGGRCELSSNAIVGPPTAEAVAQERWRRRAEEARRRRRPPVRWPRIDAARGRREAAAVGDDEAARAMAR